MSRTILCLCAVALVACGDDDGGGDDGGSAGAPSGATCDPFAVEPKTLELGELLGAGRSRTGVLYVVDVAGDDGDLRAFKNDGDDATLHRLRVVGAGSSSSSGVAGSGGGSDGDGGSFHTLSIEDPPERYALLVARNAEGVRMSRAPERDAHAPPTGSVLPGENFEIVEASELESFELIDATSQVQIGYVARTPDGHTLAIIAPDDADDEDIRLFYGQGERLIERAIESIERQRDGGSTHVFFDLDGQRADAFFPVMITPDGVTPLEPTLEVGGETTQLAQLEPTPAQLDAFSFECLDTF